MFPDYKKVSGVGKPVFPENWAKALYLSVDVQFHFQARRKRNINQP
jgi:hypothetical protein